MEVAQHLTAVLDRMLEEQEKDDDPDYVSLSNEKQSEESSVDDDSVAPQTACCTSQRIDSSSDSYQARADTPPAIQRISESEQETSDHSDPNHTPPFKGVILENVTQKLVHVDPPSPP